MKYLGKKSLSSLLSKLLNVFWYLVLIGSIAGAIVMVDILFSTPVDDPTVSGIDKIRYHIFNSVNENDEEWQTISALPVAVKVFMMFYFSAFITLLLLIIKKGQHVFKNFQKNIVFNEKNVLLIRKTSKLLIVFAIMSFNFSTLLVSLILLIITEIFKNGTTLQQEHDLTI